jgi:DNA-binding MarR family transcriptional regulator
MAATTVEHDLADVLTRISRLVRRRLRQGLTGPRLRGAQVELLRIVAARPGIGVSAAAQELNLAGNSVSTLVNQLVTEELLIRTPDPADRRAARLTVTEAARERLADWERRRAELLSTELARLAEQDRVALRDAMPALRRLAENLHDEHHDEHEEVEAERD